LTQDASGRGLAVHVMRDGLHCCSLLREAAVLDLASELTVRRNLLFFTMAALDFAGEFRVSGPKYNAIGKPGQGRFDQVERLAFYGMPRRSGTDERDHSRCAHAARSAW
jgi:hypothetical protein